MRERFRPDNFEGMTDVISLSTKTNGSIPGRFRVASAWLLAVVAVFIAVLLYFAALLVTAQTTENAPLSYVVATLVALVCAIGLARLSVRLRGGHKTSRKWLTEGVCLTVSLLLAAGLSWTWFGAPATYTPLPDSPAVQYWDLPTGSRIGYTRTAGTVTHAEPVLLVHGGPGAPSTTNDEFAGRLAAAGFAVYTYQQVGAGQSSRLDPKDYTIDRHIADLEAIRQKLAAPKVVLIGSSWGGQLTAHYMAAHPDNVAKAVVASPGAMSSDSFSDGSLTPTGNSDQSGQFAKHTRFAATFFLAQVGGLRAARTLMPADTADGLYQQFVHSLNMSAGCPDTAEADRSADSTAGYSLWVNVATLASASKAADPRPALRHNSTPVLVLRAQCDYLRWEVTREYRDTFPQSTMLTIDGAGHTALADKPAETGAAVAAFLTGESLPAKPYIAAEAPW
ncbi:alpha/beta fold hydrolase [Umezawaea endophytica]|uniref:Alpha/beta fold hydrolase n=1 Tax=Umezawaea endophytica TaxID=1654476 RepID=A0A9X2VU58_9PSEU|nr:alpha/beta fold hydrolase [Umezawaea endophytica]MCS7482935.1 alpha/beta fold hydrolase [Umezawaea endophytica]